MKIIEVKIEDIKPYENNAREHSAKQIKLLMENIKKFGFAVPIIIDKENNIIAGHGRLIAVTKMDWKEVPCVRMENLTTKEANAMRLADNKLSEMSTWNMELVIPELKEMDMELFQMTGFDPDILLGPKSKEDDIPEDVPARAKLGDVYQLDTHRIICGDSTDETVIEKLLDGNKADMSFSDLPYNIGYEGGAGKRRKKIENDKMNTNQFSVFLENAMKILLKYTGGAFMCVCRPKR
jgi:site-specific DNA-methyltransferase (adenine-specific)